MLVSAFAGHEFIRKAYEEAIRKKYRFFSYGDCMLILWSSGSQAEYWRWFRSWKFRGSL